MNGDFYFGMGCEVENTGNWKQSELKPETGHILRLKTTVQAAAQPVIVNQPVSLTLASGQSATFAILATGTGTGSIAAPALSDNSDGTAPRGSTGGGRVAVRLTDLDATFSAHWLDNISAKGASSALNKTASIDYFASPATVYLQTAVAGGEGHGTLIVRDCDNTVATNVVTWLLAANYADDVEDFKDASLSVLDCAHVKLSKNITLESIALETDTSIDLNDCTLTASFVMINGHKLFAGTYSASDLAVRDVFLDSSVEQTGLIVIKTMTSLMFIQ